MNNKYLAYSLLAAIGLFLIGYVVLFSDVMMPVIMAVLVLAIWATVRLYKSGNTKAADFNVGSMVIALPLFLSLGQYVSVGLLTLVSVISAVFLFKNSAPSPSQNSLLKRIILRLAFLVILPIAAMYVIGFVISIILVSRW